MNVARRTRSSVSHSSVPIATKNSRSRYSLNVQESRDKSEEAFEMFANDPMKKALLIKFLSQEKENIERCTYKRKKSIVKKHLVYRNSPIALSRQRALKKNRISSNSSTNSSFSKVRPVMLSPVPFNKLLEGVIAYIEVWNKEKDCSAGAKALMISMGATVVDHFTNNVTHVVFKDGNFSTYQKSKLLKIHLVSILWLEAIRKSNSRVPEKNYPALGTEVFEANITQICQDYDEMVKEEFSRSLSTQVKSRKTALPSELKLQNSDSNTSSFHTEALISKVVCSTQAWETDSLMSYQNGDLSLRRRISSAKEIDSDQLENSSSCLSSDNDSECGIVNGYLVKQKHGDSSYIDLVKEGSVYENDNKSIETSEQSVSLLSHKLLVNNSIGDGFDFVRTLKELPLRRSKSIDRTHGNINNIESNFRKNNTHQMSDRLKKNRKKCINILSDRIICNAKNKNGNEKNNILRTSKDSDFNCLIEGEFEQDNYLCRKSAAHNLIERHCKNEEEQNLLSIKTVNVDINNSDRKSSLNSENMPSLNLSKSTDSDLLKKLTANKSENSNEELLNDFNKKHDENNKEGLIQNEVNSDAVTVKSKDDKDKKLRKLFNANQIFNNVLDDNIVVLPKDAKMCKKELFIPLTSIPSTYNISNFLQGPKKLRSQTKPKQKRSKKVLTKEKKEDIQEKGNNLKTTKASSVLFSKDICNNLNSIEPERRKEVMQHDEEFDVRRNEKMENKKLRKLYNLNQSLSNLFSQELESTSVDKMPCKENVSLKKQLLVPLTPILATFNVKNFLQEQRSKTNQNENVTQQVKSSNTTSNKGYKKKDTSRKINQEETKKMVRRSLRFIEKDGKSNNVIIKATSDNRGKKRRSSLDFVPETIKKRNILNKKIKYKKHSIVCTRMHKPEVQMFIQIVKQLGEFFVEDEVSKETTHLVVGETKRTINLLRAVSRGCWILSKEWLLRSLEAGKWLEEEDFEITDFTSSVQHCRIQRQIFGKLYSMDIFENCGAIYITRNSVPRCSDMEELVEICKGKIVKSSNRANIVVGIWLNFDDVICVSEKWILDSVSHNKRKSLKKYLLNSQTLI